MASARADGRLLQRRSVRVAAAVVAVVAIAFAAGLVVAPDLIRTTAEEQIATQLGRKATIGRVRLNPFALAATIEDFKLYEEDGTSVAVTVESLFADVSSASLFKRALVLDRLRVTRPTVRITRLAPERFSFSDVLDRLAAKPKSDGPLPFSLNNIELDDGAVDVDDRVTGRRHRIDGVRIALPFLSNLPYDTAIFVTPAFAATVDGSPIALTGKAQPFSTTRETAVDLELAGVDLPDYVGLSPVPLPFALRAGKLSAKLALSFRGATTDAAGRAQPQSLGIAGHVGVTDLDVADRGGRSAVTAASIDVDVAKIDPLNGDVAIDRIAIASPHVDATRRPDGTLDLATLFRMPGPTDAAPAKSPAAGDKASPPPSFSIASLRLTGGSVRFTDQALAASVTTDVGEIAVALDAVALRGTKPTTFRMSASTDGATFAADGDVVAATRTVAGNVRLQHFALARVAPYTGGLLAARIDDGTLDASARFRIDASQPEPTGLVDAIAVRVDRLRTRLADDRTALLSADSIALDGGRYELERRAFSADAVTLVAPVLAVRRDARGHIDLASVVVTAAPAGAAAAGGGAPAVVVAPSTAPPFTATVRKLSVERGDLSFDDLAAGAPVRVRAQPLALTLENVGTARDATIPFSLKTTLDGRGQLAVDGKVALDPLTVDATIDAKRTAIAWLAAYAGDRLNVRLESADLDTRGTVHVARGRPAASGAEGTLTVAYRGSAGVTGLRVLDRATSAEFVRWKSLTIPQVDVQMPAKNAPWSVALGTVALDDFYARVIVNANGRLNLQDVVGGPGQAQSVTTPDAPRTAEKPAAATPTTPSKAKAPAAASPTIRIAGITLAGGRIGITDNFIRPNYSANLTGLEGRIAAIASDDPKPSDVRLTGRIDGDGALDVSGRIAPLATPLFIDLSADAKDIELTRLTAYAVKYAGYAIERGKLSTTVRYHIENGRLDAQNRLFLDQLTFGPRVESPTATKLPVLLAVALLKNARGEIDVNLPVSGSLDDPEFSVGGVVARVLGNLITRVVTSPFSLIASAVGAATGGAAQELGYVEFKPGVSDLTDEGKKRVELLAKGLAAKPALRLDIIGRYDPVGDPDGLRRDHLLDRLKDLKAKERSKLGEPLGRNDVTIEPDEYATWLARVYDDTKLPDKPRNVVGLAKSLPVPEMERLLLAAIPLDESDPRWLAEARADVVRHYLEDTGQVAASRVFLVTPKLDARGITDQGAASRVDFVLR